MYLNRYQNHKKKTEIKISEKDTVVKKDVKNGLILPKKNH